MEIVDISDNREWITFADVESRQLGTGDKGDYYSLLGVLTFLSTTNAIYKACPQEQCSKKLVDQENGLFRCEICNREYPNFKYRLLLAAEVSDPTGIQPITVFNEAAEKMLGKSGADISRLLEYDKYAYLRVFEEVKFKTFVFNFCTTMETYKEKARLKTAMTSALLVDYKQANARLIKIIKSITGVEV